MGSKQKTEPQEAPSPCFNINRLERDIRRCGAFSLNWDSNAFALPRKSLHLIFIDNNKDLFL